MKHKKRVTVLAGLFALSGVVAFNASATDVPSAKPAAAQAATNAGPGLAILELKNPAATREYAGLAPHNPAVIRTNWRYWETWQAEVFKMDSGEIIRANGIRPVEAKKGPDGQPLKEQGVGYLLAPRKAKRLDGSPLPPTGWQNPDFDDQTWFRNEGPMVDGYRNLSLICVRGKFEVTDPAAVPDLSLAIVYRGGVVAYLNGIEVGRASLPAGKLAPDTWADVYPKEAYLSATPQKNIGYVPSPLRFSEARDRRMEVKIPARLLRKGVNVLALQLHRAPTAEVMLQAVTGLVRQHLIDIPITAVWGCEYNGQCTSAWNHAMLGSVRLAVSTGTTGIVPNTARPKGFQVWNESVFKRMSPTRYGDPNEKLQPVQLRGVPNGTCSASLGVGSSGAIKGLKATVSELKSAQGGVIPANAIQVAYVYQFNGLDLEPPGDLEPSTLNRGFGDDPRVSNRPLGDLAGVVQPVWIVVNVPKSAKSGSYEGQLTITADGEMPVRAPVKLRVVSDWVAPDPNQFITYMGLLQSPDSVALQYKVPMWSEEHWKRLDKTFELLGQLGNRELYIALITKTFLAHEHGMVRWVKQADGTYKHDFSIAERYIDLAVKHKWNISVVGLHLSDGTVGSNFSYGGKPRNPPSVTVVDPATGALTEMEAPKWGTPEARTFWKPAIEGMRGILAKRGLQQAMMFSFVVQHNILPETISDLKTLAPDVKWVAYAHWAGKYVGTQAMKQPAGRVGFAYGTPLATFWDPDEDTPCYRWKQFANDVYTVAAPRAKGQIAFGDSPEPAVCRLVCETTLLGSHEPGGLGPGLGAYRGFGQVGADYWPVLEDPKTKWRASIDTRYIQCGSVGIGDTGRAVLAPGKNMPAHSYMSQMLRESQQEAEARVFVQNALLDHTDKLEPELAQECKQICDARSRVFFYSAVFFGDYGSIGGRVFNQEQWDDLTERLYVVAGKVAQVLGR